MTDTSLIDLQTAFRRWREKKQGRSEVTPPDLLARAKRAAAVHGVGHVARLLNVERKYLNGNRTLRPQQSKAKPVLPRFSRVEMVSASDTSQPLMEIETPRGQKVRLFSVTPETLGLLSSICGDGSNA